MTTREKILQSFAPILEKPNFVTIQVEKLKEMAMELLEAEVPTWDNDLHLLATPEETAQYYFFLDSINFCFWGLKGQARWEYKINNEWVGGYYAYCRAIKDAFLQDQRFFDADYLKDISKEGFESIFSNGRNNLLLINERRKIIQENFQILRNSFGGQAMNLLFQAEGDADKIVSTLLEKFPTFNDSVAWKGKKVLFLKRAQIFTSDLSFSGLPELAIKNLNHLTIFSDYKIPQIFEFSGVLKYNSELEADIIGGKLIPANSQKEVELRASSIIVAEQIKKELEKLGRKITINELDLILWVKAKETTFTKPHHKTLTTFY
jgi:hypothetical protein